MQQCRARSVVTSAGIVPARTARLKNRRAAARSRRADSGTVALSVYVIMKP